MYDKPLESNKALGDFRIINSKGSKIPLSEIAMLTENRGVNDIRHYQNNRSIMVSAVNDSETTVTEIVTAFNQRVSEEGGFDGATYSLAGDYETMQASYADMTQKFTIAIILVYLVLLLQFNSYLQPFTIILSVPFSIIGVAIGYHLFGLTFSTLSFLGIVSLVGISVNDAIVLIDCINSLRRESGMSRVEAIIEGCRSRFKPIIATSLTTMAGVAPLALYSEDYSQMASALIFGLLGSTVLTLIVVPTILNTLETVNEKLRKGKVVNNEEVMA